MTVLLKTPRLTVPGAITKKAGIKPGDLVEFTVRQGTITIYTSAHPDESRYPLDTPTSFGNADGGHRKSSTSRL